MLWSFSEKIPINSEDSKHNKEVYSPHEKDDSILFFTADNGMYKNNWNPYKRTRTSGYIFQKKVEHSPVEANQSTAELQDDNIDFMEKPHLSLSLKSEPKNGIPNKISTDRPLKTRSYEDKKRGTFTHHVKCDFL